MKDTYENIENWLHNEYVDEITEAYKEYDAQYDIDLN